jgi:hypothetical protein
MAAKFERPRYPSEGNRHSGERSLRDRGLEY